MFDLNGSKSIYNKGKITNITINDNGIIKNISIEDLYDLLGDKNE